MGEGKWVISALPADPLPKQNSFSLRNWNVGLKILGFELLSH